MPAIDLELLEAEVRRCLDRGEADLALALLQQYQWTPDLPQLQLRMMDATARFRLGEDAETAFTNLASDAFSMAMLAERNLASLLFKAGRYEESLDAIRNYRSHHPHDPKGLSLQTSALIKLERFDAALPDVEEYLLAVPADREILVSALYLSAATSDWVKALKWAGHIERRYGLDEEVGGLLASAFMELDLLPAARDLLGPLLSDPSGSTDTTRTIAGNYFYFSRDYAQAEQCYRSVIVDGEADEAVVCDYAFSLLATGDFQRGWPFYARRKEAFELMQVRDVPLWQGEPLAGKKILVNWEQGLGDSIQFMRYLPALQAIAAEVTFNAQPAIVSLLPRLAGGFSEEDIRQKIQLMDVQIHLADLPLICQTDSPEQIPASVPYLPTIPETVQRWESRLSELGGLKVGFVWAGNRRHENDGHRSARLSDFYPLAILPGISWISLQVDESRQELSYAPSEWEILDLGAEISDFSDTAAIVQHLDLIITVDTSVAHLAGALGRPVWILLPSCRVDWRWELAAEHTPWYPTARLIRQEGMEGWASLMARQVRPLLWGWACEKRPAPPRWDKTISAFLAGQPLPPDWFTGLEDEDLRWVVPLALASIRRGGTIEVASFVRQFASLPLSRGMMRVLGLLSGAPGAESGLATLEAAGNEVGPTERVYWAEWLRGQGRGAEASAVLRRGMAAMPDDPRLMTGLAWSLQCEGRSVEALEWFERTIEAHPRAANAMFHFACELVNQNQGEKALPYFGKAIRLLPGDPQPLLHLALHFRRRGLANISKRILAALIEKKSSPALLCAMAESLALCGEDDEAKQILCGLNPDQLNAEDRTAYAIAQRVLGCYERSEEILRSIDPADASAKTGRYLLGWRLLQTGCFERGWDLFCSELPFRHDGVPEWQGEDLQGKNIVIYQDHGFGDLIQFLPLIDDLATRGAEVALAVHKVAYKFVGFQKFPAKVLPIADLKWRAEAFDYQVSLMRLPKFIGADLLRHVHPTPFLQAPNDCLPHWRKRILSEKAFKVGIVWAGNPNYMNDWFRSTELTDWLAFGDIDGIAMYSFQKDVASNQAAVDEVLGLRNVAADCNDWMDTASLMNLMDLIISVDSGGAHVAAGLGRETWILIPPNVTDYRWQMERDDCPWYPSARLFRQARGESWREVLDRVAVALQGRVAGSGNAASI